MLNVGVFGVGHLGKFHLNNWKEIAGVNIVGFFDPNNENAKEVAEKYNIKRFLDEDKLLDACDVLHRVVDTRILLYRSRVGCLEHRSTSYHPMLEFSQRTPSRPFLSLPWNHLLLQSSLKR